MERDWPHLLFRSGKSIITRFLSLGLSASIAIAVSCTIAVTLCIGITVCYCMKLCTSRYPPRPSQSTKGVIAGSDYQPANNYAPSLPINHLDTTYCSPYIANQSSQFGCIKGNLFTELVLVYVHYDLTMPWHCGGYRRGGAAFWEISTIYYL